MPDVVIPDNMPGLNEASAQLDAMMQADGIQAEAAPQAEANNGQSVTPEQHAAQAETAADGAPKTDSQNDTPAAPEGDGKATPEKQESRYNKAQQRQEKSWAELNRQKEEFKAQQEALKAEREQIARDKAEWQKQREQQENRYTPDQYEKAADDWEAQGKYDLAEAARARAKQLRDNPPKTARESTEQQLKLQKEYWAKAAIDFPSVAKEGSPENTKLKELVASEPSVLGDPKGMYYAARLVAAETAAAGVPNLMKELGELRAKVKELESASAPSGPGSPTTQPSAGKRTDAQEFAELERMASEVGALR